MITQEQAIRLRQLIGNMLTSCGDAAFAEAHDLGEADALRAFYERDVAKLKESIREITR